MLGLVCLYCCVEGEFWKREHCVSGLLTLSIEGLPWPEQSSKMQPVAISARFMRRKNPEDRGRTVGASIECLALARRGDVCLGTTTFSRGTRQRPVLYVAVPPAIRSRRRHFAVIPNRCGWGSYAPAGSHQLFESLVIPFTDVKAEQGRDACGFGTSGPVVRCLCIRLHFPVRKGGKG